MWSDSWVCIDTETSGLGSSTRVVEVGAVVFEGGKPVHEYSQLLCPEGLDWEDGKVKEALAVNRIKREDLEGKPTFEQVLPQLLLELSQDVIVAHNAAFDVRMINQELQRLGKPGLSPQLLVCTLSLSSRLDPYVKGHKLGEVAPRYGIQPEDAHRAAVDARVCGLVLAAMLARGSLPAELPDMKRFCADAEEAWRRRRRY